MKLQLNDGMTLELKGLHLTIASQYGSRTFNLREPNRESDGRALPQPRFFRKPFYSDPFGRPTGWMNTELVPPAALRAVLRGQDIVSVYVEYSNPCTGFEVTGLSVVPLRDDDPRGVVAIQSPLGVAFLSKPQATQVVAAIEAAFPRPEHNILDFEMKLETDGYGTYPVPGVGDGVTLRYGLVERAKGDVERLHCVGSMEECAEELNKLLDR